MSKFHDRTGTSLRDVNSEFKIQRYLVLVIETKFIEYIKPWACMKKKSLNLTLYEEVMIFLSFDLAVCNPNLEIEIEWYLAETI